MLPDLDNAIRKSSAIRSQARLQSTIPGARVMPPTYADANTDAKGQPASGHLFEKRTNLNGEVTAVVLLDSAGSSANRIEAAMLEEKLSGAFEIPDITITVGEFGQFSTLELPHRCFDAYLREGVLNGVDFPQSELGKQFEQASPRNATALYQHTPISLLCGAWNSHGSKGGLGNRFARVLCAELVGFGVVEGRRAAQKTDPLIEKSVPAYKARAEHRKFTLDEKLAEKKKGQKPAEVSLSDIGFGSVPATAPGGVTISHAEQHVILSLGQLRRLRFPNADGQTDEARNLAGRAVLAALGILGVELQRDQGFSLRSGCELTLETEPAWEVVGRTLDDIRTLPLTGRDAAMELFEKAVAEAERQGLNFAEPVHLSANEELIELVRRAREA